MQSFFPTRSRRVTLGKRRPKLRTVLSPSLLGRAGPRKEKLALNSRVVAKLVGFAIQDGEREVAAPMAIGRLFLLRIPSEGIPLEWSGAHSSVQFSDTSATITLARRKNSKCPVELTRECCCSSSGRKLCAFHWLKERHSDACATGRVFSVSAAQFLNRVRRMSVGLGTAKYEGVGSHAFYRAKQRVQIHQINYKFEYRKIWKSLVCPSKTRAKS